MVELSRATGAVQANFKHVWQVGEALKPNVSIQREEFYKVRCSSWRSA